ncbi:MAG: ATP-binding protein, partial [Acidobacteriota bacterium]
VALETPEDTLANYLHAKRLLLVLDNCEHLIQACARLVERLLSACPGLKILATSREPLGITGETVWHVPSLTLPTRMQQPPKELSSSEAVRLWVDRARAVQPGFEMTEQNASAVALICRRLDGIPLAIELAAARLRALSVEQIAARLDDRFQLLTIGSRTALPRHQTLRALIDWSYDLLPEAEQILLRRLSVFAGGWTLEAAEEVCAGTEIERSHVLDLQTHLVDKSLVLVEELGGETRYRFLETIRQYASEKLQESGETETMRHRHLAYFLAFAEEKEPALFSAARGVALSRLEADWDNFRAALAWSQTVEDGEIEMRLVGALYDFWRDANYANEGQRFLDHALARSQNCRPGSAVLAKVLLGVGNVTSTEGDLDTARLRVLESFTLFNKLGDKRHAALALVRLGWLCAQEGNHAQARAYLEQSVALAREVGDQWLVLPALANLGDILQHAELPGARPVLEESLALAHELGDGQLIASVLIYLSEVDLRQGDYAIAWSRREQALAIFRESGNKSYVAWALGASGDVARLQGDYARARVLYEEALRVAQGDWFLYGWILHNLGDVAQYFGDTTRASELFKESLQHHKRAGEREYIAEALAGLAGVAAAEGQPERAARLFGAAEALRDGIHLSIRVYNRAPYDRYWPMAQSSTDEKTLGRAWAEGKAMSLEQAIDYALSGMMSPHQASAALSIVQKTDVT